MEFRNLGGDGYGCRTEGHQWAVMRVPWSGKWQASYKTLDNMNQLAQIFYDPENALDIPTMMFKLKKQPHDFDTMEEAMDACRKKYESMMSTT